MEQPAEIRGRRRVRWTGAWLILATTLAIGLIAGKAALVVWFRHARQQLADQGRLPSMIVRPITRETANGLPLLWNHSFIEVRDRLRLPLPFRADAANRPSDSTHHYMACGDERRDGWTVRLEVDGAGRMVGWNAQDSDDEATFGATGHWPEWFAKVRNAAVPWLALLTMAGIVAAVGGWAWGRRRAIAGPTLGVAICLAAALSLSYRPDRTFVAGGNADPVRWWPLALLPAAAVLAAWPARRHAFDPSRCRRCGYDLTANASGVCPECGTRIGHAADV